MLNEVEGMAKDHHRGGEIGHIVQPMVLFHEEGCEEQDGEADPHRGANAMTASLPGKVNGHHGKQQERVFQPFCREKFKSQRQQERSAKAVQQTKAGTQHAEGVWQFPGSGYRWAYFLIHPPKLINCNNVANKEGDRPR